MIHVTDSIKLSKNEISERFIRASGPGGQNVNKIATAVQLRFDAANCSEILPPIYKRLRLLAGSKMTGAGVIILTASRFRSQQRNRRDAIERLLDLIRTAAKIPKKRRQTKSRPGVSKHRLERKRRRSNLKKTRNYVQLSD